MKNWFKKNIIWLVPVTGTIIIIFYFLSSFNFGKISQDLVQAYSDKELYRKAIEMANKEERVIKVVVRIKSIDRMAIFNGEVNYFSDFQKVTSTIKVHGDKGKAKLDIKAHLKNDEWRYDLLQVRIDNSTGETQAIEIYQ
ncbi:cytochrome c oxidase assembly factor Coa1 family protein [Christiangramia sp.]|uniref:cytochrome c oxidase assembly factor Coa1 family protein n=1 Tax=Christiangramia sp. TaxID=1931228 RepID=UPI00262DC2AF|nr:cytochrome c oxidase assembly factor Coa1 family protein [Christiangramia sp.]